MTDDELARCAGYHQHHTPLPRRNRVAFAAAVIAGVIIGVLLANRAGAHEPPGHAGAWAPVAECESHNQWDINTGNGYYGGIQFSAQTWKAVTADMGRHDLAAIFPHQASVADQVAAADHLAFRIPWGGLGHWPTCGRYYDGCFSYPGGRLVCAEDTGTVPAPTDEPPRVIETPARVGPVAACISRRDWDGPGGAFRLTVGQVLVLHSERGFALRVAPGFDVGDWPVSSQQRLGRWAVKSHPDWLGGCARWFADCWVRKDGAHVCWRGATP